MRRLLTTGLLLSAIAAFAQTRPPTVPEMPAHLSNSASTDLPDAPDAAQAQQRDVVAVAETSLQASGNKPPTCNAWRAMHVIYIDPNKADQPYKPCSELINPYQTFLGTNVVVPLNWQQKGYFALHELVDPANLGTIVGISAITIGADSHTAYGPGMKGFGKITGVTLLQDASGEFFGVFAVPSLTHQDPRYYRMPHASIPRRIIYSISRSYISRSDDGHTIPNYGTLSAYPIVAVLSNLYVPGIQSDSESTTKRIFTGLALDPVNNLITEFLPDIASRVHIRIIFVQRILNNVAAAPGNLP
jgi:hypothetical protein